MIMVENQHFSSYLSEHFQKIVLHLLITDKDFIARSRGVVQDRYFSTAIYKYLCKAVFSYWDKYQSLPSKNLLSIIVSKFAPDTSTKEKYHECIQEIYSIPKEDIHKEFIQEKLIEFVQQAELAYLIHSTGENINSTNVYAVSEQVERIKKLSSVYGDLGLDLQKDWSILLTQQEEHGYPLTLFPVLTECLRGGAKPGELVTVLAKQKAGKSMILVNFAIALLLGGNNVAFYTLEMYEQDILARAIASLTGFPTNKLLDYSDEFVGQIISLKQFTPGKLIIKELPGLETSVPMIDSHLSILETNLKGPVIPVIDYLDLVVPSIRTPNNETREQREVMTLMRNLGKRHDVCILTATQGNRESLDAEEISERHQQFYNRGMIADYMFGFNQSRFDYAAGRFNLTMMLARHSRKAERVYFKQDWACARMYEISQTEYASLIPNPDLLPQVKLQSGNNFKEEGLL